MLDLTRAFNQVAKYKIVYAKIKFSCILIIILKRKTTGQNGIACAKTHDANPKPKIAVLTLPRNVI